MNAIEVIIYLFLSLSTPCNALPAEVMDVGNRDYIVIPYTCGERLFFVWRLKCESHPEALIMSRPFYIHELDSGFSLYVSKTGEVRADTNLTLDKMHVYNCGT